MKLCAACARHKSVGDYHKDKSRNDGYRGICKTCVAGYMLKYYAANSERIKNNVREWVGNNRGMHNKVCSEWVKRNRGAVNARTAKRYAAKTKATPQWLDADDHWLIDEIYALAVLRTACTGVKWEVDHIVPLRSKFVCGLHVPGNLCVIPMQANRRKSNIVAPQA